MNGKFSKMAIIAIAFLDAFAIVASPNEQIHLIAVRVLLLFLCMIPTLFVGYLLKLICCCHKTN